MAGRRIKSDLELQGFIDEINSSATMRIAGGEIVVATIDDTQVLFSVRQPDDFIQRHHRAGRFYEENELSVLNDVFPKNGVYVDIGANVGNHALYVAKFLEPAKIIPFEPNRPAIRILIENICLNGLLSMFDLAHLGLGLSNKDAEGFRMETPLATNLGMTHMVEGGGNIPLVTGDMALADEPRIDLIKVDIEGMEMLALAGLTETMVRTRPMILIEIDHGNRAEFDAWLKDAGYHVRQTFPKMAANQNFLIEPS